MPNRVCHLGLGRGSLGCPLGKSLFLKNIDFWKTYDQKIVISQ